MSGLSRIWLRRSSITSPLRPTRQARRRPGEPPPAVVGRREPRSSVCAMAERPDATRTARRAGIRLARTAPGARGVRPPPGADDPTQVQRAQPAGGRPVARATPSRPRCCRPRRPEAPAAAGPLRSRPRRPASLACGPGVSGAPPPSGPPPPGDAAASRLVVAQDRARGLAGVPGRGTPDRVVQDREGRRRPPPETVPRPSRDDVPAGRQRQPAGADPQAGAPVRRRQGRGPPYRHDHAAAHRLRPQHADVDPARLDRRRPGPRHRQDQRRLRVRRPEAARPDHRAEHRHPGRRLRRDRVLRLHRRRGRGRRRADLPEAGDERPPGQPRHQEGLPGGRRQGGPRLRPVPAHLGPRRHRPRAAPARGGQRRRQEGRVAVDGDQPDPLLPGWRWPAPPRCASGRTPG